MYDRPRRFFVLPGGKTKRATAFFGPRDRCGRGRGGMCVHKVYRKADLRRERRQLRQQLSVVAIASAE